ncbi:MAG: protein-S-isoprenylcysteine O-methyltransferase Ste14 [Planctomycetota bacterium]
MPINGGLILLFGLLQVFSFAKSSEPKPLKFTTRAFYKVVRHPIYLCWIIASWCTPVMTVDHLVYVLGMTTYMLVAIPLEERDLTAIHRDTYRNYKESVPSLLPRLTGSKTASKPGVAA